LKAPYVLPPLETGQHGFHVESIYTPFTRDILNNFEGDPRLSNNWCPAIVRDMETGVYHVVNHSEYPVYVAMSVPLRSSSLSYRQVKLDAAEPEHRLGSRTYGAVLEQLPREARESGDARDERKGNRVALSEPGARYRIAVGPPPAFAVHAIRRQREYVVLVDTPETGSETSNTDLIPTFVPNEHIEQLSANEHIARALREWLHDDKHKSTLFWLTFREYEFIIGGFSNPKIVRKGKIEEWLGSYSISETGVFKNLHRLMDKHFDDINKLSWASEDGLNPGMSRWLVDHHVLTVSDVTDFDNEMKKVHGSGWTSLFG
jgi:hypothetical protein